MKCVRRNCEKEEFKSSLCGYHHKLKVKRWRTETQRANNPRLWARLNTDARSYAQQCTASERNLK